MHTCIDSKLLSAHDMIEEILHLEWREVEEMLRGLLLCGLESPREFRGHDLDDEPNPKAEHLEEEAWLSPNEHCEVDEELLGEHCRTLVIPVDLVDDETELCLWERTSDGLLVGGDPYRDLFLSHEDVRDC